MMTLRRWRHDDTIRVMVFVCSWPTRSFRKLATDRWIASRRLYVEKTANPYAALCATSLAGSEALYKVCSIVEAGRKGERLEVEPVLLAPS